MAYALITGATSGLGRAFAKALGSQKKDLILIGRNGKALEDLTRKIKLEYHVQCMPVLLDLSQPDSPEKLIRALGEKPEIDFLINNACIFEKGQFTKTDWSRENAIINLQCTNISYLTKLLLPNLLENQKAFILNVASTGAFVPGPYNAVYCASKAYLLSFTEALAEEFSGSGLSISVLCPGGLKTKFQNLKMRPTSRLFPLMDPRSVAQIAISQTLRGKRVIIPGMLNKMQIVLPRILPRSWMAKLSGNVSKSELSIN